MWWGYNLESWLDLGVYMTEVTVLFTVIYLISAMCSEYLHKEELKRNKLKELKANKLKKADKKKYFIDVA